MHRKIKMAFVLFLFVSLLSSPSYAKEASAKSVFTEDFGNRLWIAERWKIQNIKNWKLDNSQLIFTNSNSFNLNQKVEGDIQVKVQVAMTARPASKKDWYFAAVNINGILFMVRDLGFAAVYRNPGAKRSNGGLTREKIKLNQLYNFTITARQAKRGVQCIFEVNGKMVDSFQSGIKKLTGNISLVSRGPAKFANFEVSKIINAKAVSPNILVNSSFEHIQEGMPPYFSYIGHRNGGIIADYGSLDNFWKCWTIGTLEKHSGKNSARIEFNDKCKNKVGFMTFRANTSKKPAVYSVYLKANKENLPARLIIDDTGHYTYKKIIVGKEWKRYKCILPEAKSQAVSVGVGFSVPGVLWVDDIQLEVGDKSTAYSSNNLDDSIFKKTKDKLTFHPEIKLKKFTAQPLIDGVIENIWSKEGTKIDDFKMIGTMSDPKKKTIAYIGFDNRNLYIALRSFVSNIEKVKAKATSNDNGAVWSDDDVEIFLDPNLSRANYYQLMLSASGYRADTSTSKGLGWNGKWESATKINKKDGCIDYEMRIPLADFSNKNLSDVWGLNIGRSNTVDREYSALIHTSQPNAHQPLLFPSLIWPDGVLKAFRKDQSSSKTKAHSKVALKAYTRYDYYMNEKRATLVGETNLPNTEKLTGKVIIGKESFSFKPDSSFYVEIPLKNIPDGVNKIVVKIFDGKRLVTSISTPLEKKPYKDGATQVDRERRCLIVDGKPFLMIAPIVETLWYNTPELLEKYVKTFKDAGFNALHPIFKSWTPEKNKPLIDIAGKMGMKILAWPVDFAFIARNHNLKKFVTTPEEMAKEYQENNIIAWMFVDEPELYAKPEEVSAYIDECRKAFPYHPVYMSNTHLGIPANFAGLNTDILSIDDYLTNRPNRQVSEIIHNIDLMVKAGKDKGTPVFFIPIMRGGHIRELTSGEQTAQSYGCIIAGARGLSYWANEPCYPENWKAMKSFAKEISSLNDVIFSVEKTDQATVSDKNILTMTRIYQGKLYIIAVNMKNQESKINVILPAGFKYNSAATVQFEKRKIKVKDGIFSDTFKPHERHVYCVDIAK